MSTERRPFNLSLSDWFWSVIDRIRDDPDAGEELFNGMSPEFYYSYREASSDLSGVAARVSWDRYGKDLCG
jgi:hypothetical protein